MSTIFVAKEEAEITEIVSDFVVVVVVGLA
jgi:hypothetical protein